MQYEASSDAVGIVWRGISTADGTCELLEVYDVGEEELAVWILKPGFEVRCLELREVLTSEVTTLLPDIAPQRARVVVGAAAAAAGSPVVVTQRLANVVFDPDSWTDTVLSTIEIVHEYHESSPVRLLRYAGINNVQARAEDTISATESASSGRDVTLCLKATFSAHGRISGASFDLPSAGVVEYCVRRGAAFSVVARTKPESNGSFRFAILPAIEALAHSFRYVSDSATTASVYIDQPAHGDIVEIDLTAQAAQSAQFEVVGPDQLPIAGATVHVLFESGRNPREVLNTRADMNGRASVAGLPSEVCIAYATAPGFFTSATTPIWPQYLAGQAVRIQMREGGTISGRVIKNGQPIETFDIWYLSPEIGVWTAERFDSAGDGLFSLREVPLGPVEMYASADDLGQSDVVNVEAVRDDSTTKLAVLPLLPSMAGHGVAVDSISGKPIENARVQIWTCAGGTTVGFRSAVKVEPLTGAFRTDALSAGTARVYVEAVGYAGRTVSAFGEPGADVDFGVVRLDATQALRLRVVPDGDLRLDFCSATVSTDLISPSRLFDQAGWLAVGAVVAGPCRVDLVRSDRYEEGFDFTLEAGQRVVELPVRVAPGVSVVLEEGAPKEATLVRVHHRDETGWGRDTLGNLDGGRELALPVEAAQVREVELLDANSARILRREVTAEER
ncbi:MAG: hypothetical protein KGO50_16780, partial [Myxococcales bacterium]|nr:hypothetical protein [Myxococcales bacterium]